MHTSSHICSSEARACKHCTPDAARNTPIDNPPGNPDPWRARVHALVWALTTGSCRPGCRVQSSLLERRHSGAPTRLPGCDGLNSQLERGLPPKRAPWSLPRHLPPSCAHRAAPWAQRRPQESVQPQAGRPVGWAGWGGVGQRDARSRVAEKERRAIAAATTSRPTRKKRRPTGGERCLGFRGGGRMDRRRRAIAPGTPRSRQSGTATSRGCTPRGSRCSSGRLTRRS